MAVVVKGGVSGLLVDSTVSVASVVVIVSISISVSIWVSVGMGIVGASGIVV